MKSNPRRLTSPISICVLAVLVSISIQQQVAAYSDASHYDPEAQDGIPVLSARSLPSMGWNDDAAASRGPQRRTDSDLDDGLEEEDEDDRDEYKAGSSNHDSYENPAYEESRRAARDGDDIESFFDKHIGPDDSADGPADEGEVPISELPQRRGDMDDHYEAAASSPLSNIFHSLLNHAHKNKLIITTTDDSSPSSAASAASTSSDVVDNSQTASSSATPVGSSYQIGTAPIAYFTPVAAPGGYAAATTEQGQEAEDEGPVREIYITRRPPAGYAQYQPVQYAPMSGQSSNANWRGSYPARPAYQTSGADYGAGVPVAASYAYNNREQPMAASAPAAEDEGTVSYGLSFGGSPFESADEKNEDGGASEDQTSAEEPEQPAYSPHASRNNMMRHSSSMRSYDGYQYVPVAMAPQGYARVQQHHQQQGYYGPQQYEQQQQQVPLQGAVRYHRDPSESQQMVGYHPQQQQQQHQQQQYNRASSLPVASSSSSSSSSQSPSLGPSTRQQMTTNDWATRQKLLASLDKQIKSNPYYSQGAAAATTPTGQYRMPSRQPAGRQQDALANDYDTYNSYHKEVDPFRSLTTVSQTISEPVARYGAVQPLGPLVGQQQVPKGDSNNNANNNSNGNANSPKTSQSANKTESASDMSPPSGTRQQPQHQLTLKTNNKITTLTGPLTKISNNDDLMRTNNNNNINNIHINNNNDIVGDHQTNTNRVNLRVRRDDSDDRESDDDVDDGVWVDDDEDDSDNRQQSSDLNETAQEPEDDNETEDDQQEAGSTSSLPMQPPGVIGGPHSYELSPNDLLVYQG